MKKLHNFISQNQEGYLKKSKYIDENDKKLEEMMS